MPQRALSNACLKECSRASVLLVALRGGASSSADAGSADTTPTPPTFVTQAAPPNVVPPLPPSPPAPATPPACGSQCVSVAFPEDQEGLSCSIQGSQLDRKQECVCSIQHDDASFGRLSCPHKSLRFDILGEEWFPGFHRIGYFVQAPVPHFLQGHSVLRERGHPHTLPGNTRSLCLIDAAKAKSPLQRILF